MANYAQQNRIENEYITTKELAFYAGFSRSFFEKARCNMSGPSFHKLGGKVLYKKADVDAWLNSGRNETGGAAHD